MLRRKQIIAIIRVRDCRVHHEKNKIKRIEDRKWGHPYSKGGSGIEEPVMEVKE